MELDARLGEVRQLSKDFMAGGQDAARSFRDLAALLLQATVLAPTTTVILTGGPRRNYWVLGGQLGPTDPLALSDGRWLRLSVTLVLDTASNRLKVAKSAYQYQLDREGHDWVFRYDYLREPGNDPHPVSHLNVNGTYARTEAGWPILPRIHFPVWRASLEGVIRLLAQQFRVPCRDQEREWWALLAESESVFHSIAHVPLSGPGLTGT